MKSLLSITFLFMSFVCCLSDGYAQRKAIGETTVCNALPVHTCHMRKCVDSECGKNSSEEAFNFVSTFYRDYTALYLGTVAQMDDKLKEMREENCSPSLLHQIEILRNHANEDDALIKSGVSGENFDPLIAGYDFSEYSFNSLNVKEKSPETFLITYYNSEQYQTELVVRVSKDDKGYRLSQIEQISKNLINQPEE